MLLGLKVDNYNTEFIVKHVICFWIDLYLSTVQTYSEGLSSESPNVLKYQGHSIILGNVFEI